MSPLKHSNNLAARMGRWSAGHKKTAIFGWLAFIAVAFMIGNAVGTKQLDPNKAGTGESGHVDSVLREEFTQRSMREGLRVHFPSRRLSTDNAAMIAAAAYPKFLAQEFADPRFSAEAALALRR